MRILAGGLHTECSTYSPLKQTAEEFRVMDGRALGTHLAPATPESATLVPLCHARSLPGGPVTRDTYDGLKHRLLDRIRDALPAEGVFLPLHGAMHVDGLDDPEGDLLEAVRTAIGPDLPIAVSYDLHGNVSQAVIDAVDIFAAYRTAPHVDVMATHRRALAMLADMIARGTRRFVGWAPIPVLMPGEKTSTEDEPARSLYAALPEHDARPGVCDANVMVGYVWADTPRATAASVVTGTDRAAIARSAEELARAYWDARQSFAFGMDALPLAEAVRRAASEATRPVILADSGDNPTGGGVGDRADVLAEMLAQGVAGAVFAGIADPSAALAAAEAGQDGYCALEIGGRLGSDSPTVPVTATVETVVGDPSDGTIEAVVAFNGLRVVLTQRRRPFHSLADFRRLGLEPADIPILVVKSGYLSPELAAIANPPLMALTDGAVNQDIERLANRHRPRPCYPFDTNFGFTPLCRFSVRATSSSP